MYHSVYFTHMEQKTLISLLAFAAIFLCALFLFIRNYPSDRWFSVVFIAAGGVLLWSSYLEEVDTTTTTKTEQITTRITSTPG